MKVYEKYQNYRDKYQISDTRCFQIELEAIISLNPELVAPVEPPPPQHKDVKSAKVSPDKQLPARAAPGLLFTPPRMTTTTGGG